ncbi:hypothetical protein [Mesonia aquimarina]|uniref:hypothetical protein n=1 Tax=Mesonia aquimarina TaxID=1504967 RepID=UPI000EF5AFA1|nr:hypothetical protein [Mesonia aquimarina]
MNKILLIGICSLFLIGCCHKSVSPKSRLNGNVKKITEHLITNRYNSNDKVIRDTLYITEKLYNQQNQIIELDQDILFDNENMHITYIYDRCGKLKKEHVKMSFQESGFDVFYIYKNSLLHKITTKSIEDSLKFVQMSLNEYDINSKLIKSTTSQTLFNLKSRDTIKNSVQTDFFNEKELIFKSELQYYKNLNQNLTIKNFYKKDVLVRTEEFDYKDSLITVFHFEYKMDSLSNWISRKKYESDSLRSITTREFLYKN